MNMNDFRYKLAKFFQGRTGVDALGKFCAYLALIMMVITMFSHLVVFYLLGDILLIYSIWRMFSKNYQKRYQENQKYLLATAGIRRRFANFKLKLRGFISKQKYNSEQRRIYSFFKCPQCKQKLRAPKGRGKIEVTCRTCGTKFIKKV